MGTLGGSSSDAINPHTHTNSSSSFASKIKYLSRGDSSCWYYFRMTGAKSDEMLVSKTQEQILKEAAKGGGGSKVGSDGIHEPIEPVPDLDWVGETWGLFWPDIENEMEEKKEDPCKYLKKHYPDPKAVKDPPPPTETATIHDPVAPILCPEAPVVKKEPTPPVVKLRPKKEPEPPKPKLKSPPRLEVFEGPVDIDNDNSKWGWMRAEDKSASKARFRLSIFW